MAGNAVKHMKWCAISTTTVLAAIGVRGGDMRYLFLLAMLIVGCGQDNSNNDNAVAQQKDAEQANDENKVNEAAQINDLLAGAKLVMPGEAAPECVVQSHGLLIYVKEDAAFYYCDNALGWTAIDLRGRDGRDGATGKDGRDGLNGRDGLAGKDGKDGINGKDGRDGLNGKDGQTTQKLTEWIHPITGDKYFVSNDISGQSISSANDYGCPSGSSMPSLAQAENLWKAGIFTYFGNSLNAIARIILGYDFSSSEVVLADAQALTRFSSGSLYTIAYKKICKID